MYELRHYQKSACDAAWNHLLSTSGNPVIELPTGSGKSLVIAELCRAATEDWAGRVLVLAHRKELLQQNAEKIASLVTGVGIYSAGLKTRQTDYPVVCCGIQSVHKRAAEFGERHLVVIDEAHLVPGDGEGMYRWFLDELRITNPKLRMVGLTATPYRTGEGALCRPDGLFQRICYSAPIPQLISDGFLSPIISTPGKASVNTEGLHVRAGEFVASEAERLFDVPQVVTAACQEIIMSAAGRKSIIVFCSGVVHAAHVASEITRLTGEQCGTITGDTIPLERSATLGKFKAGLLRWLTNVDVLTTGFDAPCIDCIPILRATYSPGLFAQICGRGFRLHPGKKDCLVLDFGENIQRHGPLDAIDFGKRKKASAEVGDAPTKSCPNCENEVPLSVVACPCCGLAFPPRQLKHGETADGIAAILSKPIDFIVEEVSMGRHQKRKAEPGHPDTLKVDYLCRQCGESGNLAIEKISEWVCLDHEGFAGSKAVKWWRERSDAIPVKDEEGSYITSAVNWWRRGAVATPTKITAVKEGRFWRITGCVLDAKRPPEEWLTDPVGIVEFEEEEAF